MDVKTTILENGLKVVTIARPQTETVSCGVWVNTGSSCETANINGVSHFVEHMVFKGTKKRSSKQIYEDIENVGGQINAYTSREMTVFYVKMLKNDIELGIDVICDFVMAPLFLEDEMQKEREVIIQEINQTNDDPGDIVFDYFQAAAFNKQPLGMSILGPAKQVKKYAPEILHQYMNDHYGAENMVFAAVGNLEHEKIVEMVRKRMSGLQAKISFIRQKQYYTGGQLIKKHNIEQAHVVLGFSGVDYYNDDYYSTAILSSILGGGMSSRLFQKIREELGLVYSVYSFSDSYADTGIFGIYAGLSIQDIERYITVVADEMKKIASEKISDIELNRTKAQFKSGILSALESSFSTAELIARQSLVYKRVIPIEETLEKINAVSKEDILRVAEKILNTKMTYTLLGNFKQYPLYDDIETKFHS